MANINLSGPTGPVSAPCKESQFNLMATTLMQELDHLTAALGGLQGKLSPILNADLGSVAEKAPEVDASASQLECLVDSVICRIKASTAWADSLIKRSTI